MADPWGRGATVKTTIVEGTRKQKVVIELRDHREWWVLHHDGRVEAFDTASHALRAVRRAARRRNTGVTVTTIEWRNVPEDWTPPT